MYTWLLRVLFRETLDVLCSLYVHVAATCTVERNSRHALSLHVHDAATRVVLMLVVQNI
jgi:hypothetical protein